MSVYFVYRCHYAGPTEMHVKRFESASVLDWFRHHWRGIPERDAAAHAREVLGFEVYSFDRLFVGIADQSLPPPATMGQLQEYLQQHLYGGQVEAFPHAIQALTDDDELEMALYFFDDHFLAEHGKRAAFLLHEDWRLPEGPAGQAGASRRPVQMFLHDDWQTPAQGRNEGFRAAERTTELAPRGRGEGATYVAILAYYDSGNLIDLEGGWRIAGVRVPDLARYLACAESPREWPDELNELRSQLFGNPADTRGERGALLQALRDNPQDDLPWAVYSDWLEERGERGPGPQILQGALRRVTPCEASRDRDPAQGLVQVGEHVAQACLHTGDNHWLPGGGELFHRWIFFDDLWAGADSDLANAILRFARRWDVLAGR